MVETENESQTMLPTDSFQNQVILITGGGTGLGLAMGLAFSQLGATIAVASRKQSNRDKGVAAIQSAGGQALGVELDVRQPEEIAAAFNQIEAKAGPVNVLINNAAGNFPVRAENLSPNGWKAVTGIVLDGSFFCAQEFHRRAVERQEPGAVLNILGTFIHGGAPGHVHSAAAKAGVHSMTETLAVEWAPDGIRVNAVAPGIFPHADHSDDMRANRPEGYEAEKSRIPLGRTGRLEELGWAATFLCSRYAGFITGHMLIIDGGDSLNFALRRPEFTPIRSRLPN